MNHPFVDGNKRTLVAMTLLIAESQPREKEVLTGILANLIDRRN